MITKAHIQNFRSIKDTSITMQALNVLVGVNGAGKSTLLEALVFTKKALEGNTIADAVRSYAPLSQDFFNYYCDDNIAKFSFEIETKKSKKYNYSFSVGYSADSKSEFYVFSERLSQLNSATSEIVIFDRRDANDNISLNVGASESPLPISIENNRLFLATLSHEGVKDVLDTIASYQVLWADERFNEHIPNRLIVDSSYAPNSIDDLAVALYLKDRSVYDEAMETIGKIIPEFIAPGIYNLSEMISKMDEQSNTNSKKSDRYIVDWKDSRHTTKTYTRFAISGGNLRVIHLILSLYSVDSRSCFMAEEIENGMHPGRVKRMVQLLISIAKRRKIQILFSTHSYLLTSQVLPRDIIFCEYVDGEGSKYTRLSETEQFNLIKETLSTEPTAEDLLSGGLIFDD